MGARTTNARPVTKATKRRLASSFLWLGLLVGVSGVGLLGCKKEQKKPAAMLVPASASVPVLGSASGAASASAASSASAAASSAPAAPAIDGVVLITVDAFRADQPFSGYELAKTPHLDALAKKSVLYTHAYSLANTTTPSLNALLAARYPTELARDNCPLAGFTVTDGLPKALADRGVFTLASHGHSIFSSSFAPKEGFKDWRVIADVGRVSDGAVTGEGVANQLIAALSEKPKGPFFAWAHFVDPHDAYVAHEAFPKSASPVRGLYDGEVAYTDFHIGRVLTHLEEKGLLAHTAVIVTADHGEAFNEHGTYRHGYTMYDEEVRVPLMLAIPGRAPTVIDEPRSAIDLAKTIAELLQVEPNATWRGTSLLRDLEGKPVPRDVLVDAPELMSGIGRRAFVRGSKKIITESRRDKVFDLADDPKEAKALLIVGPAVDPEVQKLRDEASAVWKTLTETPSTPCTRDAFKK
jgi:choline-sulfatase